MLSLKIISQIVVIFVNFKFSRIFLQKNELHVTYYGVSLNVLNW